MLYQIIICLLLSYLINMAIQIGPYRNDGLAVFVAVWRAKLPFLVSLLARFVAAALLLHWLNLLCIAIFAGELSPLVIGFISCIVAAFLMVVPVELLLNTVAEKIGERLSFDTPLSVIHRIGQLGWRQIVKRLELIRGEQAFRFHSEEAIQPHILNIFEAVKIKVIDHHYKYRHHFGDRSWLFLGLCANRNGTISRRPESMLNLYSSRWLKAQIGNLESGKREWLLKKVKAEGEEKLVPLRIDERDMPVGLLARPTSELLRTRRRDLDYYLADLLDNLEGVSRN